MESNGITPITENFHKLWLQAWPQATKLGEELMANKAKQEESLARARKDTSRVFELLRRGRVSDVNKKTGEVKEKA